MPPAANFRLVGRDALIGGEEAPIHQDQRSETRHRFRRWPDAGDSVSFPGASANGVGVAAPDVDDFGAVEVDRDGCTKLGAGGEVGFEDGAEGGETGVAGSVTGNFGHWR